MSIHPAPLLVALLVWLLACSATKPSPPPQARENTPPRAHFGAAFSDGADVGLAALLEDPSAHPDRPVRVEGMVRKACTRRGCWMELATAMADDAPGCRVIMKDHAFFVPTDSAGSRALVEGYVQTQTVSAAVVAHMEGEGGRFPNKNPDGTATEVRIVASGVDLQRL
jgi:hypothetical protein